MLRQLALVVAMIGLVAGGALAQQLETNSPGGSLQAGGSDPHPGFPFYVSANGQIEFEVGGTPFSPYALVLGSLAATSFSVPILGILRSLP